MRKNVIKPMILTLVFFVAMVVIGAVTNFSNEDLTTSMSAATLPVVYLHYEDTVINELHGYTQEMDVTGMRDTITPIGEDRELTVKIASFGQKVKKLSYQIRSMDSERLVADGEVTDLKKEKSKYYTTLKIQNILEKNEEYVLILTVSGSKRNIHYYTRITQAEDFYVKECLDFAMQFHEYTFREDAAEFIPTYMDPASGDATTLNYVDLSCTLKQITWGDFKGTPLTEPIASLKEVNSSYNVIVLQYVLTSVNESQETEYYNIEEYYRLRQTDARMFVLNFERTMNQIFRGENNFVSDTYNILLGIRNSDVEYKASEAGDIICFVQEGELWCYHVKDHMMVQVFSFLGAEGIDARENWKQHDIKIIRMDEAGSVDFIVYGYMNRGTHEGEVGMGVYHYDGLARTIEEEAFVPFDKSFEVLKSEMGQLMYENEQSMAYLMMEGSVYKIDLGTLQVQAVVTGLGKESYAISASNRYIAWVEDVNASDTIHLMDLRTGKVSDISDGSGVYLRPLGFLEEDFIYGAADTSKVVVNAAGNTDFPMDYLKIIGITDKGFEELKEYSKSRRYIDKLDIANATITIHLLKKNDGQYVAAGVDSIMNREAETEGKVVEGKIVTDQKETQVILSQSAMLSSSKLKMITPKNVILDTPRTLTIPTETEQERYYVYSKGKIVISTDSITEAISAANDTLGIVVDEKQNYVWLRARKSAQSAFEGITAGSDDKDADSIAKSMSALLYWSGTDVNVNEQLGRGLTPKEVLEQNIADATAFDLTGCSVDEVIFYVSCQSPVFAMTSSNSAVLITGYNGDKIFYYNPSTNSTESISYEDADMWFAKAGSIFFTYLKN